MSKFLLVSFWEHSVRERLEVGGAFGGLDSSTLLQNEEAMNDEAGRANGSRCLVSPVSP